MSVPILVVTGFLGAGKTTYINDLLHGPHGLRIAAIVNDFGSINIDEALLESATDEVIGLRNGCICCSLQGDLLRTLKQVLGGKNTPDLIVIEASGVADPQGIIEGLLDPVLWQAARLEGIICLVDAGEVTQTPARLDDPLWLSQVMAADVIHLSKCTDLAAVALSRLELQLATLGKRRVFGGDAPPPAIGDLLGLAPAGQRKGGRPVLSGDRFVSAEWRCDGPVDVTGFQQVIGVIAPKLFRAKGFVTFTHKPDSACVFQLVGQRATVAPHDREAAGCALVLIGERGTFDPDAALKQLDALV
ncbi:MULTISPECIES: GTP-binding protein [Rhodobacterales]|uniref:CobW family GTP-binding protein n=1 Tax=Roseobacter sp. N2S TaxID=2663844 RepID=UPI0028552F05|nr:MULTISPECIES: GTP-binding protein [Rhodobacterales]MDR6266892.1 G3E family GTPase [Roseobacter sp. N2S]